jgi:PAS domain S-box-containing protein
MLENTDDYIYFKDRNHVFTAASKSLVSLTSAHKREDLTGKIDYDVFDKELADKYFKLERQIFDGKLKIAQELQPTLDKDGNRGVVDNRKYPIHNEKGNIIGLFGIARILSEQK